MTREAFRRPRALGPGARVAIVAPASPFDAAELDEGAAELRALGFEPVYDESVRARRGYVAGEPAVRADALMRAWRDPDVAAVIGVRGGYGSVQLLPLLDADELRRLPPKAFVGYSDLTTLLSFLTLECGDGGVPRTDAGRQAGEGRRPGTTASRSGAACARPSRWAASRRPGSRRCARATRRGRSWAARSRSSSPRSAPRTPSRRPTGHVLFLDEVGERPYRIDRMLTQLAQSGLLARAAAVVFGELPGCDEPGGTPTARAVVADLLREFPGPVLFGFSSGHTTRPALTLPFGVRARVVGGPRPRLLIEEAAVSAA